jgi:hypothetical protein
MEIKVDWLENDMPVIDQVYGNLIIVGTRAEIVRLLSKIIEQLAVAKED